MFDTKRVFPDNASPQGPFSPMMKLALIAAPVVALYSPTVLLLLFATKRLLPDNASPKEPCAARFYRVRIRELKAKYYPKGV